ncbi:DAK2 domain-containing protein [Nonomuraea sp. NPDC004186]
MLTRLLCRLVISVSNGRFWIWVSRPSFLLIAVIRSISKPIEAGDAGLHELLAAAARAATAGAEATAAIRARRGRASYVGERAVGVVDPGARTVAYFFQAGADTTR